MTSYGLGRNVLVLGLLLICGAPPSHQFLAQPSAPDAFEDVHTVHLRTGIVDVDAASRRYETCLRAATSPTERSVTSLTVSDRLLCSCRSCLPCALQLLTTHSCLAAVLRRRLPESLTPAARRLLGHPSSAPPPAAPGWGPLAGAQLWLLTLGPETHLCPHHPSHHQHSQFLAHQQMRSSDGSSNTHTGLEGGGGRPHQHDQPQSSVTSAQQEQETAQGARFAERQAALQAALRNAGAAPVSFLPPAAWLVVVGRGADLGPLTEAFPDVRMVGYDNDGGFAVRHGDSTAPLGGGRAGRAGRAAGRRGGGSGEAGACLVAPL